MQSRVKRLVDVSQWEYFFAELPAWDQKVCDKLLRNPDAVAALSELPGALRALPDFTAAAVEEAVARVAEAHGIPHGKLNQPLRAAITGTNIGAGIFETAELIGRDRCVARLEKFPR